MTKSPSKITTSSSLLTQESPTQLNPALKAALDSLDLEIENELNRYRRVKHKDSGSPNYTPTTPQVIPIESLDLEEIIGLVHQPEQDLSNTNNGETSAPEDYLESSARLLSSLAENDLLADSDRPLLTPIKTPWGISSIVMLLLGFSLLSLTFIPQKTWAKLPWLKVLFVNESTDSSVVISESQKKPPVLDNPNLAESEFLSLKLNNLSTIEVKTDQKATINKSESNIDLDVDKNDTTTQPQSQPSETPNENLAKALLNPVLDKISSQTDNYDDTPASTSVSELNKKYYYVFVEYKGEKTLLTARKVIPDAYLVQFPAGKRIQLGAFINKEDANRLVRKVQPMGISASVYEPN